MTCWLACAGHAGQAGAHSQPREHHQGPLHGGGAQHAHLQRPLPPGRCRSPAHQQVGLLLSVHALHLTLDSTLEFLSFLVVVCWGRFLPHAPDFFVCRSAAAWPRCWPADQPSWLAAWLTTSFTELTLNAAACHHWPPRNQHIFCSSLSPPSAVSTSAPAKLQHSCFSGCLLATTSQGGSQHACRLGQPQNQNRSRYCPALLSVCFKTADKQPPPLFL